MNALSSPKSSFQQLVYFMHAVVTLVVDRLNSDTYRSPSTLVLVSPWWLLTNIATDTSSLESSIKAFLTAVCISGRRTNKRRGHNSRCRAAFVGETAVLWDRSRRFGFGKELDDLGFPLQKTACAAPPMATKHVCFEKPHITIGKAMFVDATLYGSRPIKPTGAKDKPLRAAHFRLFCQQTFILNGWICLIRVM